MAVKLFEALTTKDLRTENNMPTHSSSGSFVVDFYYKMGGYRKNGEPLKNLVSVFYAALGENPNLAVKALFNLRDPRGGMGERKSGRILWHFLANSHPEIVRKLLHHIPAYSRWDDLFYFLGTPVEEEAMDLLYHALLSGDKLAGKWTPREKKRGPEDFKPGVIAKILMKRWGLSPKLYRELLVKNTDVVETLMCGGNWGKIVFQHVPGSAMKNYRNAFKKYASLRFQAYLEAVKKGEAKINTSALSPVDIVEKYLPYHRDDTLEALWSNLPDVVPAELSFLPICDLSGSMMGTPMYVSISLGIYLAQHNKSQFRNGFITFSQKPDFVLLTGKTLLENLQIMKKVNLAQNTDLEAVFMYILGQAVKHNLRQEDLPTHLMIISDMQFDECLGKNHPNRPEYGKYGKAALAEPFNNTALEMIRRMYRAQGYEAPSIFFWNVRTSSGVPAKITDNGVGLVSGYSPNLLLNVLSGKLDPLSQVEAILNSGRYSFVDEVL
jgi:hypothetical protein